MSSSPDWVRTDCGCKAFEDAARAAPLLQKRLERHGRDTHRQCPEPYQSAGHSLRVSPGFSSKAGADLAQGQTRQRRQQRMALGLRHMMR